MKHQKEMEQLEKNQREQLDKLEKFNEQVGRTKEARLCRRYTEYLEELTEENLHVSISAAHFLYKPQHLWLYGPLSPTGFLSVNESKRKTVISLAGSTKLLRMSQSLNARWLFKYL